MSSGSNIELRKFVAPEFVFGDGAAGLARQYAENLGGSCVFMVTDQGVIDAGWADQVLKNLRADGLSCSLFSDLSSNPKDTDVMAGVEAYRQANCNIIVAVGGGSPIDCAKGIGIVISNGGHILDYEGIDRITMPCPPLICIPTTIGASADVSQFAIITDTQEKRKIAIVSKALVPEVSLTDPATSATLSTQEIACGGFDALTHAIESYVSNASSPITDLFALEAARIVSARLVSAVKDPSDLAARCDLMLATLEAGLAFSNASLGIVHAMAHSMGGYYNTCHGETNAHLLAAGIDYNYSAASERYQKLAAAIGIDLRGLNDGEKKDALLARITALRQEIGIGERFVPAEISSGTIETLVQNALRDPCLITNPRPVSGEDLKVLYERTLEVHAGAGKAP
jgi:alcohol dehydrogenase class IV